MKLALFDLDHTLLSGDSDVLWCDFLMAERVLDRTSFGPRNAEMEARYKEGTVSSKEFTEFFVGTLAGRTPQAWEALRQRFAATEIYPRIPPSAHALLADHRSRGDVLVLTTATNRFITELTAEHLGIEHLLATDCEQNPQGEFTGCTQGTLNMREGKVSRLRDWLADRGVEPTPAFRAAHFYSDSRNDLPLLSEVGHPVAVDPDPHLLAEATARGWRVLRLDR